MYLFAATQERSTVIVCILEKDCTLQRLVVLKLLLKILSVEIFLDLEVVINQNMMNKPCFGFLWSLALYFNPNLPGNIYLYLFWVLVSFSNYQEARFQLITFPTKFLVKQIMF